MRAESTLGFFVLHCLYKKTKKAASGILPTGRWPWAPEKLPTYLLVNIWLQEISHCLRLKKRDLSPLSLITTRKTHVGVLKVLFIWFCLFVCFIFGCSSVACGVPRARGLMSSSCNLCWQCWNRGSNLHPGAKEILLPTQLLHRENSGIIYSKSLECEQKEGNHGSYGKRQNKNIRKSKISSYN